MSPPTAGDTEMGDRAGPGIPALGEIAAGGCRPAHEPWRPISTSAVCLSEGRNFYWSLMMDLYTDDIACFPTHYPEGIVERCWPRSRVTGARLAVPIRPARGPWRSISRSAISAPGRRAQAVVGLLR